MKGELWPQRTELSSLPDPAGTDSREGLVKAQRTRGVMSENQVSVFWAAFGGSLAAGVFTLLAVVLSDFLRSKNNRPQVRLRPILAFYAPTPEIGRALVEWPVDAKGLEDNVGVGIEVMNKGTTAVTVAACFLSTRKTRDGPHVTIPTNKENRLPFKVDVGGYHVHWAPLSHLAGLAPGDYFARLRWAGVQLGNGDLSMTRLPKPIRAAVVRASEDHRDAEDAEPNAPSGV